MRKEHVPYSPFHLPTHVIWQDPLLTPRLFPWSIQASLAFTRGSGIATVAALPACARRTHTVKVPWRCAG